MLFDNHGPANNSGFTSPVGSGGAVPWGGLLAMLGVLCCFLAFGGACYGVYWLISAVASGPIPDF